jgi:NADH:ubiquinone oxidoreductase subunit F (NADH-binding)
MLADKDRIFTNLYGFLGADLQSAMKRGNWDGTKKILELGPEAIVDAIKKSGLRGRGGLPDRPQMVVHAQADQSGTSALPRGQRR